MATAVNGYDGTHLLREIQVTGAPARCCSPLAGRRVRACRLRRPPPAPGYFCGRTPYELSRNGAAGPLSSCTHSGRSPLAPAGIISAKSGSVHAPAQSVSRLSTHRGSGSILLAIHGTTRAHFHHAWVATWVNPAHVKSGVGAEDGRAGLRVDRATSGTVTRHAVNALERLADRVSLEPAA